MNSVLAFLNNRQEPPALARAKEVLAANAEKLDRQVVIRLRTCKEGENFWTRLPPDFQRCLVDYEGSQSRLTVIAKAVGRHKEVERLIEPIPEQVRPEGLREILKEAMRL